MDRLEYLTSAPARPAGVYESLLQSTFLFLLYGLFRNYLVDPIGLLDCLVVSTVEET